MNRITLALENDFEGKVIASFNLEEYAEQIRADAIDECIEALGNNIWDIAKLEQLKSQKKEQK